MPALLPDYSPRWPPRDERLTASLRDGKRRDGSPYWSVLYRLDGKQRSTSFNEQTQAEQSRHWSIPWAPRAPWTPPGCSARHRPRCRNH